MAKRPEPPIRVISILVGIMIGCVLAYAYQVNLPTLFYEMNVAGLAVLNSGKHLRALKCVLNVILS